MFKHYYKDFDLSNAHPNFIFIYAKKNKVHLNGAFELFISNRKAVVEKVFEELTGSSEKEKSINKSDVKGIVLRYFYRTWDATCG